MPYNRDLLWQLFLGVLPYKSSANWNQIISDERISYYDTKKILKMKIVKMKMKEMKKMERVRKI